LFLHHPLPPSHDLKQNISKSLGNSKVGFHKKSKMGTNPQRAMFSMISIGQNHHITKQYVEVGSNPLHMFHMFPKKYKTMLNILNIVIFIIWDEIIKFLINLDFCAQGSYTRLYL
jgi:hypothetical protein